MCFRRGFRYWSESRQIRRAIAAARMDGRTEIAVTEANADVSIVRGFI